MSVDRRSAFPRVRAKRERAGKCPRCKKKVLRKKTFTKMLEPGGDLEDLRAEVKAIADAWKPPFMHRPGEGCRA